MSDQADIQEQVTTVKATPTLVTVASFSAGNVVGSAIPQDQAKLSGGFNISGGSITFKLHAPDTSIVDTETVPVTASGTYNTANTIIASQLGTYTWSASYTGDGLNVGVSDQADIHEQVTTVKATPTLLTVASFSAGNVVGSAIPQDKATLSGGFNISGGSITFKLHAPDTSIVDTETVTVTGSGIYNTANTIIASQLGTYTWSASYTGDGLNVGANDQADVKEQVTTVKATPTLVTVASFSAGNVVGSAIPQDQAKLSGGYNISAGSITFKLHAPDTSIVDTETVPVTASGTYNTANTVIATQLGTYTWSAIYTGDGLNVGANDQADVKEQVTTVKATPTLVTVASFSAGNVVGSAIPQDQAKLSGGYNISAGSITFKLHAPDTSIVDTETVPVTASGTYNTANTVIATQLGTYTWSAIYTGDGLNVGANDQADVKEQVTTVKATPTLVTVASFSAGNVVGSAIPQDQAKLSGGFNISGGSITFKLKAPDNTIVDTELVPVHVGVTTYNTANTVIASQLGTYTWSANYTGDGLNVGANDQADAKEQVTTVKAQPAINTQASASSPGMAGSSYVSDTAVLTGGYHITGGTITFTLTPPTGSPIVETVTVNSSTGTYTTPTPILATQVGTYKWSASYSGDGLNNGAVDPGGAAEQVTIVAPSTDLTITKTDGVSTYTPGSTTTYTIVVSNKGLAPVSNAPVVDNLPAGITSATWTAVASAGASVAAASGTGSINTTVSLNPNTSVTFTVVAQISAAAGSTTNVADFTTLGANNTALAQSATVSGIKAEALYLSPSSPSGPFQTTNTTLYLRNQTNDHGLGIVSNGENAALGGDVNEISNQLNLDVLRLTKPTTDTWTSLWVSSLDSGGSGGAEMGTLYWSNSPNPDLTTLAGSSFTFRFGDFGSSVEGDLLTLNPTNFVPTMNYLFFRAGPNACGNNNDYLFWKATTSTPGNLVNTATVSVPAGVTDTDTTNNSSTDTDTPGTKATPTITTCATITAGGVCGTAQTSDTVTVGAGSHPTGMVTFSLTSPDGITSYVGSIAVNGDGTYSGPSVAATEIGTYTWHAAYSGDIANNSASDNGANESVTTVKAAPAISTTPTPAAVTVGVSTQTLKDSAVLAGGFAPTGTITFTLYLGATLVDTETASVTGNGTYVTPLGYTLPNSGTVTGTYQWNATYTGDTNNKPISDINNRNEQVVVSPAPITVTGTKFNDITGNGFSGDDSAQSGVTINLYMESNSCSGLQTGVGGDRFVSSAVTGANGSYSFTGLTPGAVYYVMEVVPAGYVQTGGGPNGAAGCTYYTICAQSGQAISGKNFDDFLVPTCTPTGVSFTVNNNNCLTVVTDLRGKTSQGNSVTVTFTVPAGPMSDQLSLVSYIAPGAAFDATTAYQQQIFDVATGIFAPGKTYSMTVLIPNCYYQIDLVCGQAINVLGPCNYGPDGSNIFYSAQGRLLSADNGGTQAFANKSIASGDFGTTALWTSTRGMNVIKSLNGGSTATSLAQWLATTFPNLYGISAGSHALVNSNGTFFSNSQVLTSYASKFTGGDQQVLATALSVYATSINLAGISTVHSTDSSLVTSLAGSGMDTFGTGVNYGAFGLTSTATLSVMQLLVDLNANTAAGATVSSGGNAVFSGINSIGNVANANLSLLGDGFGPADIRNAYAINNISLDGTGQTIAIVDAFDNPNIFASVDAFDNQFGSTSTGSTLFQQYGAASSFLTVVNQRGETAPLPAVDPTGGWEMEIALDVEWAHAMAPGATIVLVEANSQELGDLMSSVAIAARQPGVSVVSMSWGFREGVAALAQDEALYDSYLTTPAGHQGVTFVASTGDYGSANPEYPAFSPNVVAVGGTSLHTSAAGTYQNETGWGYFSDGAGAFIAGGGGISTFEAEPTFQSGVQSTGFRTTPDVSMVADPNTGVWFADTYNLAADNAWQVAGGTSLSAPSWAGLFALVNQGRAAAGSESLNSASPTEAQLDLYSLPSTAFHTVSTGTNGGYNAGAGYNLVAGLGTPVADTLVSGLVAAQWTGAAPPVQTSTISINPNGIGGSVDFGQANIFDALVMTPGAAHGRGVRLPAQGFTSQSSQSPTNAIVQVYAAALSRAQSTLAVPAGAVTTLGRFAHNPNSIPVDSSLAGLVFTQARVVASRAPRTLLEAARRQIQLNAQISTFLR